MSSLQRTPLYERHRAAGAKLVPFAGWEMPVQYEGVVKEHEAVRSRAGLFDVSHMGELDIEGAAAGAFVDRLVTNDAAKLTVGRAMYTVCCNDRGTILDDLIVYRLADQRYLVVCNASNRTKIRDHFTGHARGFDSMRLRDISDETALLALQGPRAVDILTQLGAPAAVLALAPFHLAETSLAGIPVTVARTGYTGEDGFELFCEAARAVPLWDALRDAGQAFHLAPVGLGARDTLRLEARLMLYGNDIDETTNPYEAGLGWVVKLEKGDFVGRGALRAVKQAGVSRRLVGFEMLERGIARHGYPIVDASGAQVGHVTSGAPGLTVGKNIGLGYVPKTMSKLGTKLGIRIRAKVVAAKVVRTPFYKREAHG